MADPNLKVVKEEGKFVIRDDEGTNYGAYEAQEKAEEARTDWVLYYQNPLVF